MLMPRKVKHRKQQRGRMSGKAKGGSAVTFGDFGIQALEPAWLTARQIEAPPSNAIVSLRMSPPVRIDRLSAQSRLRSNGIDCRGPRAAPALAQANAFAQ